MDQNTDLPHLFVNEAIGMFIQWAVSSGSLRPTRLMYYVFILPCMGDLISRLHHNSASKNGGGLIIQVTYYMSEHAQHILVRKSCYNEVTNYALLLKRPKTINKCWYVHPSMN